MKPTAQQARVPHFVYQDIPLIGRVLWFTGMMRLYRDGNTASAIFRAWHPLTWLLLVVLILPCAILGEKLTEAVPLRLSNFWRQRRGAIQWVSFWTDLNSLPKQPPFRVSPASTDIP